jgi:hypothetical protein
MYYPVLRAKQFELLTLRELKNIISANQVCPVLEPVRSKLEPLIKTISELNSAEIEPLVIINPSLGDFHNVDLIHANITNSQKTECKFLPCFSTKGLSVSELESQIEGYQRFAIYIEEGISKELVPILEEAELVLVYGQYRKAALKSVKKVVVVEDHFKSQKKNSEYPEKSFFSEAHVDYKAGNVVGFGDYTIVGREFSETGGPAYVVTLHLSYIDEDEFDAMYVRHFKSFDDKSPTRPGKKFGDSLVKLVDFYKANTDKVVRTSGIVDFMELAEKVHFPGLGQVKKISMKHHIETLNQYLVENTDA